MVPQAGKQTLDSVRATKSKVAKWFRGFTEVNGVGIVRVGGGYRIKVNLTRSPPKAVRIPTAFDGIPVVVDVVGPITKRTR